jgi:hypothetical protein
LLHSRVEFIQGRRAADVVGSERSSYCATLQIGGKMAKNDSILIDGIIARRVLEGVPSADIGEVFEYFSFEQILKTYDLSEEEFDTGWVDGRHDGGIDGFFIFVNGHLVSDVASFPWPKSHAQIDIFVISCKHHDTFKESTLNSILASVQEIFDLSLEEIQLKGAYSKDVLNARKRLVDAYKRLAITSPQISLTFVYSSRGDTTDIGESVRARSEQIVHAAAGLFSKINVTFEFLGATELIERYRKTKQFALDLPFQDHLAGTGEGYIIVAKLEDYYRFVSDDKGDLRRYLFDSNVRDYLGENKVNVDISASLENEIVPDFWWLNNGITILTTKAVINGKNMQMQDIQVVNGLQTTETIYRHFSSGSRKSADGTLSIKIIVSKDERLRDQVIRATNNQSAVEQAALHATDKIQRDIEQILERYEFYYERRKNYYRNIGRPQARFVTPLFVAAGYVAIIMRDPAGAAVLKSRFMRKQESYEQVFSAKTTIEVWPRVVAILKAVEEHMLSARREQRAVGERFFRTWRGLIGLLVVARSLSKFDFTEREFLQIGVGNIDNTLVSECWGFVEARRKGAFRPSHIFVQNLCRQFAEEYSLSGADWVGRRKVQRYHDKKPLAVLELTTAFVDQVDSILPRQPWPQGTHLEVAARLNVEARKVTAAIRQLIDSGRRLEQIDGELFDEGGNAVKPESD